MTQSCIQLFLDSEDDTKQLAKKLAALQLYGSVWLSGDLGAGKTTLTRYWLQAMGHRGAVKSPTYTLVEPYVIERNSNSINQNSNQNSNQKKPVYHVDLYRLQDPEELEFIGFTEYQQDEDALLIIEWASRAKDYLTPPLLNINITQSQQNHSDNARIVTITVSVEGKKKGVLLTDFATAI